MPKNRRKAGGRRSAEARSLPSDEEYDTADNWSTASVLSEDQTDSIPEEDKDGEEVDESGSQEHFEDKLKDAIEGLSQKSAQGRKNCLEGLIKAFSKKYLFDFLADRKVTVSDGVIRCLRKGKGDELALAARSLAMLCIQLAQDADEIMEDVKPVLLTILADNSANIKARGECAIAVAMCAFITCMEFEDVVSTMEALENIFRLSFRKGDKSIPTHSPEVSRLHGIALTAWCLLLSIAPQYHIDKVVAKYLSKLPDLLESQDVDLRIVAGETIALFYELGREEDEEFQSASMVQLCESLRRLSTESHKYVAKKDRRHQKSSFRDILRAVQEGEAPEVVVKFGPECLEMYTWVKKVQYSAFCQAISSGVYQHLQWNPMVREVFGLGAPLLVSSLPSNKPTKWERTMYNAAAFKARTKARAKFRDKRAVTMSGTE
ncbi:interferon-related developmental regulator 2-like isoform X1 [Mya arenaria]|uniref:interferon-related developmental regulator 2-like isoform X1 n=1 Tax=Mya arenaria TaxID=6604 RepID=UPI0022E8242C|nr:interferon-related developmental regulator 2-like isoform X1 [Mya arenaria]